VGKHHTFLGIQILSATIRAKNFAGRLITVTYPSVRLPCLLARSLLARDTAQSTKNWRFTPSPHHHSTQLLALKSSIPAAKNKAKASMFGEIIIIITVLKG
jgi:hypothetical protein